MTLRHLLAEKSAEATEWVTLEAYAIVEGLPVDDVVMRTLNIPEDAKNRFLLPGLGSNIIVHYDVAKLRQWLAESFAKEAAERLGAAPTSQSALRYPDEDWRYADADGLLEDI